MEKRVLGRTGIQVGEIGMGCEGLIGMSPQQVEEMVDIMETRSSKYSRTDAHMNSQRLWKHAHRAFTGLCHIGTQY